MPARPKSVIADLAGAVDHHVRRLEIAMDDAALVGGGQPGADLPGDLEGAVLRKASDPAEQRCEVLAVHVLHRQESVALDLVYVVDAADVRMRDLPRHPHLGVQLGEPRGVAVDVGRQELERDRLPELEVVGAEDLAHAAAAQSADNPVAAAEERAGGKAAVIDAAGGGEQAARLAGRTLRRTCPRTTRSAAGRACRQAGCGRHRDRAPDRPAGWPQGRRRRRCGSAGRPLRRR